MIDQDIRDALKVEPSPEFVARVRTRIANEPAPSGWRWSWTFAVAGGLAAAIAIAVVVSRPPATIAVAPAAQSSGVPPVARPFPPANDDAGLKPRATANPARTTAVVSGLLVPPKPRSGEGESRTTSPAQPEILFDSRETIALRRLIASVREGRVDLAAAQPSGLQAPMELDPVTDIVITPITVEPIAPLSGAEGVRP